MDLSAAFLSLANMATGILGAPFYDALVIGQATQGSYDDDGEFVPGSAPTSRACKVQIDAADWAMRQDKGYVEGTVKFIVLAASLSGALDADAEVEVTDGPNAGRWLVSSLQRDPAGIGWTGRGVKQG